MAASPTRATGRGIAAAGNSGTVIANLLSPRLASVVGWHNVLGLAMPPLGLALVVFLLMAKDSPRQTSNQPLGRYMSVLGQRDLWWFCLFYSVTFGGYVGLSSFLPIFFRDQYGVSKVTAGYLTAMVAFVGSGVRPLGGYMADRIGGVRLLSLVLVGIGAAYLLGALLPPLGAMLGLLVVGVACLGMGNGAVFQLVPQRFRTEIGVATGIVGAVGGVGGFLLPLLLGNMKSATGSFGLGFLMLSVFAFTAVLLLRRVAAGERGWRAPIPLGDQVRR